MNTLNLAWTVLDVVGTIGGIFAIAFAAPFALKELGRQARARLQQWRERRDVERSRRNATVSVLYARQQ
jgi:hypothetical protein